MSFSGSDLPGLLPAGLHPMLLSQLEELAISRFPLSRNRPQIVSGFKTVLGKLLTAKIIGDVIVDGSFLTEEIEPHDIDFALCVSSEFHENSVDDQRKIMDWIGDDKTIKRDFLSDCYPCVEFPAGHSQYFDGIQNREWWINLYRTGRSGLLERGLAVIALESLPHV